MMKRVQYVITIEDPQKGAAEWTPDDVETAMQMYYVLARDRGVIFRAEPLQMQMALDV